MEPAQKYRYLAIFYMRYDVFPATDWNIHIGVQFC